MEDNKEWLAGVADAFETAISQGDYVLCKEIIQKVRDEGFEVAAKQLQAELVEEKLGTFLFPSDIANIQ